MARFVIPPILMIDASFSGELENGSGDYAMNKEPSMLWVVRGTDQNTEEDVSIVIEAETSAEAHYLAERRGFPVVIVEPASEEDVRIARKTKRLHMWQPKGRHTCFGRPVGGVQLACLMLCGVFTALTVLHSSHVLGH